jgi:hypothetical protein
MGSNGVELWGPFFLVALVSEWFQLFKQELDLASSPSSEGLPAIPNGSAASAGVQLSVAVAGGVNASTVELAVCSREQCDG